MENYFKQLIPLFGLMMIAMSPVKTAEIVGSDITWKCTGKDSFEVTVTVYQDCGIMPLDSITLYARCAATGDTIDSIRTGVDSNSIADVTPLCKSQCSPCGDTTCNYNHGIEKSVYRFDLYLGNAPNNCCKVLLSWKDCCRSNSNNTGVSGRFYIEATLNRCVSPCDNSPVFLRDPNFFLCNKKNYVSNLGVFDRDTNSTGSLIDSLVYSFTSPLNGAGQKVSYSSPFSYDKSIDFYGFPNTNLPLPKGLHLDSQSGKIRYRPNSQMQTVMAFSVKSYRNGKMISEIMRDVQVVSVSCGLNNPPGLSGFGGADTQWTSVCANTVNEKKIFTTDVNFDSVTPVVTNGNVPGNPTVKIGNQKLPDITLRWNPDSTMIRKEPYTFFVRAQDNNCPVYATTMKQYYVRVKPDFQISSDIQLQTCGRIRLVAKLDSAIANDTGVKVRWYKGGNFLLGKKDTVYYQAQKNGFINFTLEVEVPGLCKKSLRDTVQVTNYNSLSVFIGNDTTLCPGELVILDPKVQSSSPVNYLWLPDSQRSQQYITMPDTGMNTYWLKVTDMNECEAWDSIHVFRPRSIQVDAGRDTSLCPNAKNYLLTPEPSGGSWSGKGLIRIDTNTYFTPGDTSLAPGKYRLDYEIADSFGCSYFDRVFITKLSPVPVDAGPDTLVCYNSGSLIELTAVPGGGEWFGRGLDSSGSTWYFDHIDSALSPGWYPEEYHYTDTNGCTFRDTMQVYLSRPVSVDAGEDHVICPQNDSFILGGKPTGGTWSGKGLSRGDSLWYVDPANPGLDTGKWWLQYEVTDTMNCTYRDSVNITLIAEPEADFTGSPLTGEIPLEVEFSDQSRGSVNYHKWYFGDSAGSVSKNTDPVFFYEDTGWFDVQLFVMDTSTQCIDSLIKTEYIYAFEDKTGIRENALNRIIVYPNPSGSRVTVDLTPITSRPVEVLLFDPDGRLVRNYDEIEHRKMIIKKDGLHSGLYLLSVKTAKGKIYTGKIKFK